ncbi:acyl-CoA thioesterase [Reinekea blandensis]|uniref:Hypothetical 4-hydroxybenzoyl-CoA thioesterase n=1 Tax=Reinekea blandensis MED297 TaxID=314283 RepID=A4BE34_9GAMM|nr:thioesterase family protein [Reinekea blandensis]EAR09512.1 hypothetical 4-hydroxybenzoyl-CoA thioesterase [Reinekea blandensis MED297]
MALTMEEFRAQYPVIIELPVQWGDMDALQHVNNVIYLKWFESARIEYMNRIEFMSRLVSDNVGPILASQSVRYRLPVEYPDQVLVGASASSYEARQLVHSYGVFSQQKQALVTTGEARMVMYDFNQAKKVDIPEDILDNIRALEP